MGMVGKSRIPADEEERKDLQALAHSRERGEADRARAILLTLSAPFFSFRSKAATMVARLAASLLISSRLRHTI
jgi:hypothetical protein